MDDYETHDDRRLLPGTGFTIEPGIYTKAFGVRTEINMVIGEGSAEVTGPCQRSLVKIGSRKPG
jgi:Xaa-Pro aminopeptidase